MTTSVRALAKRALRTASYAIAPLLVLLAVSGVAVACVGGAEPTTLTTSLSGESKSGASITVLEGTKVKDQATLEGKNAAKATGKISYAVYKDSSCKELVTKAGEFEFKEGKVPASEEKTLEAGKVYYWQASYGGDSLDSASTSTCGGEVLTIKAATSLATSLSGESKSGESITVLEGSGVRDKATLSGTNSSTAAGKVKFKVYKDSECKELATEAGEGTVSSAVAESEEKKLTAGAVYHWQASYEGDSLHQASTSSCAEVLTIKAATALSTSLSGESKSGESITVLEGAKVKDKATLTGTAFATATGKVTYAVYADAECKEPVAEAGEVTVAAGSVPSSEETTLAAGRTYYWQAVYGGDALHQPSISPCGKEVATVKASTSLSTSLSSGAKSGEAITVSEGAKVKDQATLSGTKASTATGTIKYFVYSDGKCEELVTGAGEFAFTENKVPVSEEVELEAGAVYYWQAEYSGDSLHQGATGICGKEVLAVKASTSIETSLSGDGQTGDDIEVEPEAPVVDDATIGGTNSAGATGTIEYRVFADAECEELAEEAGGGAVEGEEIASSEAVELPAGIYYWQATYSGDGTHDEAVGACNEREKVAPGTTLTTSLLGLITAGEEEVSGEEIEVPEGAPVRDSASLGGENAETATGNVSYAVYSDAECKELVAIVGGGSFDLGEPEEEVEEAKGIPTSNYVTLAPGTYYWQAAYSGDDSNKSSTSVCGSEVLVVEEASLTTALSDGSHSGSQLAVEEEVAVTDLATLHLANAATATGTIEYDVYYDEDCEELAEEAGEFSLEAEGKVPSSTEVPLPAGTYYWQAVYSGDLAHPELSDECGDEILVVAGETSLETFLSGGEGSGAEISVREGEPVTDSATLNGPNTETATGTIEYFIYTDENCEKPYAQAGGGAVEGEEIASSEAVELPAGTYYWQAAYLGDLNNQEAESVCGSEILNVKIATVTTSLSGGGEIGPEIEVGEEVAVKDSATLNIENPTTATGTIEYFVYEDEKCEELAEAAGGGAVEGKKIASSEELELPEGVYYWRARYSGDGSHPEAWSVCGAEMLRVADAEPPWIISLGDSYISGEGGRWAGNVRWNNIPLIKPWIDALGPSAYENPENDEGGGEEIPRCHRSKAAEIFIRYANAKPVRSKNFACSGAETVSEGFWKGKFEPKLFKPGVDDTNKVKNDPLPKGQIPCVLPVCKGQVRKLKEFATNAWNHGEDIKMVVLSIGGNDFGFADFVQACAGDFIAHVAAPLISNSFCKDNPFWKKRFEDPVELNRLELMIQAAIERVAGVMAEHFPAATLLVQDYQSPIPRAADIRYGEGLKRLTRGRCPIRDADADWANNVALVSIDNTVKNAVLAAQLNFGVVKFMELKEAFNGRRLCEKGTTLVGKFYDVKKWTQWDSNNPGNSASSKSEWINQIRLMTTGVGALGNDFYLQEDLHPNYWGQLGLRACVRKAYLTFLAPLPPAIVNCRVDTLAPGREPIPAGVPLEDLKSWMREPRMFFSP